MDTDIYLFKLNQDTHELNLVGESATSGLGVSEYCTRSARRRYILFWN